jgi:ankyrin repeat protein
MLVENYVNINARGKNRRTALSLAAEYRHGAIIQLLLNIDADIMAEDDKGWTALHFASRQGNEALVQILISNSKGITRKCEGG